MTSNEVKYPNSIIYLDKKFLHPNGEERAKVVKEHFDKVYEDTTAFPIFFIDREGRKRRLVKNPGIGWVESGF